MPSPAHALMPLQDAELERWLDELSGGADGDADVRRRREVAREKVLHRVSELVSEAQPLPTTPSADWHFQAVAENIPQLAWMTDERGEVIWFNRRWVEYTGMALDDMRRNGWTSVHHPEHPYSIVERWMRTIESGVPWEDTFQLRRHDGTYRWFLSRAFPIRDPAGRITRWFGTNTDITDLRDAQDQLKKANLQLQQHTQDLEETVAQRTAQLRQIIQELETFSYTLTHDIRAPLGAMRGFSQVLESDFGPQLGEQGLGYVRRIVAAAERLDRLIHDVLAYSRVGLDAVGLFRIDVAQIAQRLVDNDLALQPPRALITIRAPLLPVVGNESLLEQIASNLLYNAVKYVGDGKRPEVQIWTEPAGECVDLFFQDNGIGIPPEARDRVFGLFQRFHADRRYHGTGLGLAIVRKAAERMGGSTRYEPAPAGGSVFIVRLNRA